MSSEYLKVSPRVPQTKAKELRREGYVPGVLYGQNKENVSILFNKREIEAFVQRNGETAVLEVSMEGNVLPVRIQEVQKDPISRELIHLDLMNVDMEEVIKTLVPIRFEDREVVERLGLILQLQKESVEVEGRTKDIPSFITVSLSVLKDDTNVRVGDIEVPEDLTMLDDPDELIASAIIPSEEEEPEDDADVDTDDDEVQEPELIGEEEEEEE